MPWFSPLLYSSYALSWKLCLSRLLCCYAWRLLPSPIFPCSCPHMTFIVSSTLTCILCKVGWLSGLINFWFHRLTAKVEIQQILHKTIIRASNIFELMHMSSFLCCLTWFIREIFHELWITIILKSNIFSHFLHWLH